MNDHNGNLEKRIGISTISLANITLSEAIDNILGAGFKAIEVFMGLGDYAAIGWPRTAPGPGLHPDACFAVERKITHERFGHLVDPTQGFYGMRFDVDKLLDSIAKSRGRIVEVHMHSGRYRTWSGHAPHLALSMHNEFDYPLVIAKINETGFNGTFMFEITAAEDLAENIEHCRKSKEMLIQFQESGGGS